MRYAMASIVEHLSGKKAIREWPRKVGSMIYNNFRFIETLYSNDLVRTLMTLCESQQTATTVVLQTGDWDFTVGISRVTRDPRYSRTVSAFTKNLLEGSIRVLMSNTSYTLRQCHIRNALPMVNKECFPWHAKRNVVLEQIRQ
jgi:hypothetical protein